MKIAAGFLLFLFLGFFVYYSNLRENIFASRKARFGVPAPGPVEARPKTYDFVVSERPPVKLNYFQNRVVYVNFWASWCEPCRREFPLIEKLKQEMGDRLQVILINLDTPQALAEAKQFQLEHAPTAVTIYQGHELQKLFNVEVLPFHMVIDKQGRTAAAFYASLIEEEKPFRSLLLNLSQE